MTEDELTLAVLGRLREHRYDASDEARGWTLPISVAQILKCESSSVIDEFLILAAEGFVELKEMPGGTPLARMAKITTQGEARLARLAKDKRARAEGPTDSERVPEPKGNYKYAGFISHASNDAKPFVDELFEELTRLKVPVWYDGERIAHGDSNVGRMNDGLRYSRCGIVIASCHYFKKTYTMQELDALLNQQINDESRKIIPVLFGISQKELRGVHPILATHSNIDASKLSIAEVARFIQRAIAPRKEEEKAAQAQFTKIRKAPKPDIVRPTKQPVFAAPSRFRKLAASAFVPGIHAGPYDALPEQEHLLETRPIIKIDWLKPRVIDGVPKISWTLSNVGAGVARDVGVFLAGIASYKFAELSVGQSVTEDRNFDDRYAYHEIMKPPVHAIVEFADVHGNIYRAYADIEASPRYGNQPADYKTTLLGHPYPVANRIVVADDGDRFRLDAPIGWPEYE